LINKLLKLSK